MSPSKSTNPETRIKVCGLTRHDDVRAAVGCGVDAIGLMFYPPSSRFLAIPAATELARLVPAFVNVVAVFADPDAADVAAVCERVPLHLLQFHGDEDAVFCEQWGRPYIKGVRMRDRDAFLRARDAHPNATGFLVDAYEPGVMGGTGNRFDWAQLAADLEAHGIEPRDEGLILAGGLTDDNVGRAIATVRPWAVDVSSGVESAPGEKSAALVAAFTDAARETDRR